MLQNSVCLFWLVEWNACKLAGAACVLSLKIRHTVDLSFVGLFYIF